MSRPLGDAILSRSLSGGTDSSRAHRLSRQAAGRCASPPRSCHLERLGARPREVIWGAGTEGAAGSLAAPPAPGLAARCSRREAARPPQPSRGAPTWAARLGGRGAGEGTVPGSPPGGADRCCRARAGHRARPLPRSRGSPRCPAPQRGRRAPRPPVAQPRAPSSPEGRQRLTCRGGGAVPERRSPESQQEEARQSHAPLQLHRSRTTIVPRLLGSAGLPREAAGNLQLLSGGEQRSGAAAGAGPGAGAGRSPPAGAQPLGGSWAGPVPPPPPPPRPGNGGAGRPRRAGLPL